MKIILDDNDAGYECHSDTCHGEIPAYTYTTDQGLHCEACDAVILGDDREPDRDDPDPDFHNSNAYDITTGSR